MASGERKATVWEIKKRLHQLTHDKLIDLLDHLELTADTGKCRLDVTDEECCFEYIVDYMTSESLLELEDGGFSQLLLLKDNVDAIIQKRNVKTVLHDTELLTPQQPLTQLTLTTDTQTQQEYHQMVDCYEELGRKLAQYKINANPSKSDYPKICNSLPVSVAEQPNGGKGESMISLRDLQLLPFQPREFRIQGGQIGDSTSDISYTSLTKQIDEGLAANHSENDIIRGVLRVIKPGNFKDMLVNKDGLTIPELKSFLQSHLNERSSSELFQELMCGKQNDNETPQQFLYRLIGLKQKLIFLSKQAATDLEYDEQTIQNVFLRTIYQGMGAKYNQFRTELKPLLMNRLVTDEALLRQVTQIASDESERQRRLGHASRPRVPNALSAQCESSRDKEVGCNRQSDQTETIRRLSAQIEALTKTVESLAKAKTTESQCKVTDSQLQRKQRRRVCPKCSSKDVTSCSHCFVCGGEGHRAVGCLRRDRMSGNDARPLMGGEQ
jgi:hypothetical protein